MEIVDNNGRKYQCVVNIGTIAKAEKSLGVNLCRLLDTEQGIASLNDPLRVCEYIYHTSDAQQQGVSFEEFGAGFSGDTLGAAMEAFNRELSGFFQNPRKRSMSQQVIALMKQAEQEALAKLEQLRGKSASDAGG